MIMMSMLQSVLPNVCDIPGKVKGCVKPIRGATHTEIAPGVLTIYTVPRVCQHQGCDLDKKCKRKGMFFGQKCKRKGVLSGRE